MSFLKLLQHIHTLYAISHHEYYIHDPYPLCTLLTSGEKGNISLIKKTISSSQKRDMMKQNCLSMAGLCLASFFIVGRFPYYTCVLRCCQKALFSLAEHSCGCREAVSGCQAVRGIT